MRQAWQKLQVTYLLRFSAPLLVFGLLLSTTTWATAQIVVPGLSSEKFSEAWIEGELLLLKREDGRLYSVPIGSVDFESLTDERNLPRDTAPTLSDIVDLLLAGVSEPTIKAYIESGRVHELRFDISKETIIELKRAGASEAFIQYLIRVGRAGSNTTYIYWRGPSAPRRQEPPALAAQESVRDDYQQGIPYFPYVFPGFGVSYPLYPAYPSHPIYPSHPSYPTNPGYTRDPNLQPGATPGFYWPESRSWAKPNSQSHSKPKPTPHNQTTTGDGQLWLRWKGGSNDRRSGSSPADATGSSRGDRSSSSRRVTTPGRGYGSIASTQSGTTSRAARPSSGWSSRSATRSSGARSFRSRKQ